MREQGKEKGDVLHFTFYIMDGQMDVWAYGHRDVVVEILFQMKGSQHSVCHEKQCHYTGLT